MPSPSSQNLRSAPQKQPRPKIAFSEPGYALFRARPLTKCVSAVGIGCARPGRASAAEGMLVFLKPNIVFLPADGRNIGLTLRVRNARGDHESSGADAGCLTSPRCQR